MTVPPLHDLQQQLVSCSHESSEFQGLGQPWDLEKCYWPVHDLKCVLVPPDGLSNSPEFPQGNREAELVYRLRGSHRGAQWQNRVPCNSSLRARYIPMPSSSPASAAHAPQPQHATQQALGSTSAAVPLEDKESRSQLCSPWVAVDAHCPTGHRLSGWVNPSSHLL